MTITGYTDRRNNKVMKDDTNTSLASVSFYGDTLATISLE
jgi:hypothetical protein